MRQLFRQIFFKPVLWLTNRFSSKPDRQKIFEALSDLLLEILNEEKSKGIVIPFDKESKFIIFSDQHKGKRNGADDFMLCEPNYLAALDYYHQNGFYFISLGDSEELWETTLTSIKREHLPSFEKEKVFIPANAFIKIFGNHDLYWQNDPFAQLQLNSIYGYDVPIYEGVVLQTVINEKQLNIFCTHGHQGDKVSDGNWFSKFFISRIWAPLQAYLRINPNTPAYDAHLKTLHNKLMYEWSIQHNNLLLITGHTHQPIFESLTHLERLYRQLLLACKGNDDELRTATEKEIEKRNYRFASVSEEYLSMKPSYFNTGCCCFNDGDITGIEIAESSVRLVKWQVQKAVPTRLLLEEASLEELM
jgi:predicted phosphodiesterase